MKVNGPVLVRIKLPAKGVALMLKPNCMGHPCSLTIRSRNFSLPNNHSQSFDYNEELDDGTYKALYSRNATVLHLNISVLRHINSHRKGHKNYMKISLEMFSSGCFYWDQLENSWNSDGCKVNLHVVY